MANIIELIRRQAITDMFARDQWLISGMYGSHI